WSWRESAPCSPACGRTSPATEVALRPRPARTQPATRGGRRLPARESRSRCARVAPWVCESAGFDGDDRGHGAEAGGERGAPGARERHGAGDRAVGDAVADVDGEVAHGEAARGQRGADVEDALHATGGHDLVAAVDARCPGGAGGVVENSHRSAPGSTD